MFLSPSGTVVPGFVVVEGDDGRGGRREKREFLQMEEGVLFADLDLREGVEARQFHELGSRAYQRDDVFGFRVDRRRRGMVEFVDG